MDELYIHKGKQIARLTGAAIFILAALFCIVSSNALLASICGGIAGWLVKSFFGTDKLSVEI